MHIKKSVTKALPTEKFVWYFPVVKDGSAIVQGQMTQDKDDAAKWLRSITTIAENCHLVEVDLGE